MPTIQIDTESNALVLEALSKEKQAATLEGLPTRHISKNKLVSDLIKRALVSGKPPVRAESPKQKK